MRGLHLVLVTKRNARYEEVSYARSALGACDEEKCKM